MKKSIKIVDFATNLIQMAGLNPKLFPIKYTGLRPGEKLEEELQLNSEMAIPTAHKKIKIWKAAVKTNQDISKEVEELLKLTESGASKEAVIAKLKTIVVEYPPDARF